MTFKEKLAQEFPDNVDCDEMGECVGCPDHYKYEDRTACYGDCAACWNREMPGTKGE